MSKQPWLVHVLFVCVLFHVRSHAIDSGVAHNQIDIEPYLSYTAPDYTLPGDSAREVVEKTGRTRKRKKPVCGPYMESFWKEIFGDILGLHKNLFLWDSFKVIATTFPIFVGARMIDEKLQNCFYDACNHKNLNQMPRWCHDVAKASIAAPIVFLGLKGLLSDDWDERYTSQIMLLGIPFVIWTKKIVKQMKFQACLRPWNEHFSCEERSFGGFPSGHMAEAMFLSVLFGRRYGPRYAMPLGALAAFLGITFVTCNRHYLSQVVGGAGFGTMYALAANTLVNSKLGKCVQLGFALDDRGAPAMSLAFKF